MNPRLLILSALTAACISASAQEFKPSMTVNGVMRSRWEMSTIEGHEGENRFAIRNARLWLSGKATPNIDYFMRADFCDMGKIKFLDGWTRFKLSQEFSVQTGQFRIPFGRDTFKGPGNYIFANRSFLGKDEANNRAVGFQVMYKHPSLPLNIHTGVFSPHSISDHYPWSNDMTFATKATLQTGCLEFTGGFQTIAPAGIRMNMADAAVTLTYGQFTAEAEYMYTHYTHKSFADNNIYNTWAKYDIPMRKGMFNNLAFMGRFEGTGPHSTGVPASDGKLIADNPARRRLTLGTSLAYIKKPLKCELQLNYERYIYNKDTAPTMDRGDKIVTELILLF